MASTRVAIALCLAMMAIAATADLYMMFPQGGNDRLDDQNRDRDNGNRLWDSQNNNRGGNNHGTFGREYFYTGSILKVEWTNQHSCGNPNANCDLIVQYYCDNNVTRDGITSTTIPDVQNSQTQCSRGNCDLDARYGRHESYEYYQNCKNRQRNRGLYTSTQDLQGNGAIFTRQNPNGNRHGYECPEERDYYPYWAPTPWIDVAVITNDTQRCPAWQAASENQNARWSCQVPQSFLDANLGTDPTQMNVNGVYGFIPNNAAACTGLLDKNGNNVGAKWVQANNGVGNAPSITPMCIQAPWTRDNHLGNTFGSETPTFEWTIPAAVTGAACVFRMRYNISTSESRDYGDWASPTSVQCGALNSTMNYHYITPPNGIDISDNDDNVETDNPLYFKYCDKVDVWSHYGMLESEIDASTDPNKFYTAGAQTRGYVFRNDPVVDIFGSLLPETIFLRLAFDTSQFGRTFQDRSHTFSIFTPPSAITATGTKVYNLGVRGKRGNIVQNYPGVEYDFVPNWLTLNQGDWIHFQWQGSNFNPQNNAGQGTAGTDRSNIVSLNQYGRQYAPQAVANLVGPFSNATVTFESNFKLSYPARIDGPIDFLGLSTDQKRILAVYGIYSPYFDMAPAQMKDAGYFAYLCTRNNAFTNRGQKAVINVVAVANAAELMTTATASSAQLISPSGTEWIRYAPDPNGYTTNSQLAIQELGDNRILITPYLFDVIPGQSVMLDMVYTQEPMTNFYIYQSDYVNDHGNQQPTQALSGVATCKITRGGYYQLVTQVSASAVAGVVIGVLTFIGLAGFGYYKLNQKFHFRDKKYIAAATQMTSVTGA